MSVYVELVAFNNFAVDVLLEVATLTFFRRKIRWWRVLLGGIVGSAVATLYPLCPTPWQVAIKVLLAPILALIFDGDLFDHGNSRRKSSKAVSESKRDGENEIENEVISSDKKSRENRFERRAKIKSGAVAYVKRLCVFCLFTYLVGGIDFGVSFALGIDLNSRWQLGVCALALLTLLISVRIFVLKLSKNARKICDSTLRLKDAQATLKSLCDSGNTLTDSVSGLPVVIISSNAEKSLFVDESLIEGFIVVKTVSGEGTMPIVRLDDVYVKGKRFCAYGALSRRDFDGVDVILQNTMF